VSMAMRKSPVVASRKSPLVARYRAEGDAAFTLRSRRPHTSPARLAQSTIDLIVDLREKLASNSLDNGPHTIAWHLAQHHGLTVSAATISRHLRAAGLITPRRPNGTRPPTSALPPHCPTNQGLPTPRRAMRPRPKKGCEPKRRFTAMRMS